MASRRLDISSLLCDDNPPFSPLDALVHAATEERRRLEQPPPPPPQPQPSRSQPPQHHQSHRSYDELEYHRQQQAVLDRRRFEYEQREYELQRQRDVEEQQILLQQQQQQQQLLQQRELERRELLRREAERERRELERREAERREAERREFEHREVERQLAERREFIERQQQREAHERQLELDRRREQDRNDELRRRHQLQLERSQHAPILTSPHPPSISHLIHSPTLQDRPHIHSHPTVVSLDPPSVPIPTSSHDDPRPNKKRRCSESPTRPIPDDKERIARERDKMLVGELGYGRVESPIAGPSHPPRRPGSGHGHVRKVADLLTVDKDRPTSTSDHRVLSPLGRRSPPGSQIGRAKAARKSDEFLLREPPPDLDLKKPKEEPKVIKQEPKPPSRPHETVRSPEPRPKKLAPPPPPPKVQPVVVAPKTQQQDDAHEWFLQQYDEEPSPSISVPPEPPHTPSPSLSPVTATAPPPAATLVAAKSPPVTHRVLTPMAAAVSLEEELEELVSKPISSSSTTATVVIKPDTNMDLDVDLAVTELVETLEADVKHEPKPMEVDVEDELLSLLDDTPKPPLPLSSTASRRNPPTSSSTSHGPASIPSSATHSHGATKQPPHQHHNHSTSEGLHISPPMSAAAAAALSPITAVRHASTRPTSERGSMPPPASTAKKERADSAVPTSVPAAKKKKETKSAATAAAKTKNATPATTATSKPKAKSAPKGKKGAVEPASVGSTAPTPPAPSGKGPKGPATTSAPGRKTAPSASRSRSTSVMPPGSTSVGPESDNVKPEKQEEEEDTDGEANEDDKLYCVCKTKYDEDRFMIACDKCDEWYHTQCVKMPDLEVDLVDQFICPVCIEKNPHLNLRTTYKTRCLYGLRHPDPTSTKACHKAARGAFSKYCSDECGVKYMQSRIDNWAKKGGKTDKLWESVKGAEKREGVVCAVELDESDEEVALEPDVHKPAINGCTKMDVDSSKPDEDGDKQTPKSPKQSKQPSSPQQLQKYKPKHPHIKTHIVPPTKTKLGRETDRLNNLLDSVIKLREEIKRGMEIVVWRERLLQLASERAELVGQCGWDQRLCMDDQEWADIGAGVLESYDEAIARVEAFKEEGGDGEMEVDGAEEQWWCPGKKVCDRHQGWQTVRLKDVCKEKEKKEEALAKLTTREREIRKRIEDMLDPQTTTHPTTNTNGANGTLHNGTKEAVPLKSSNAKSVNGHTKSKAAAASSGDTQKKGKKRKAPAS